MERRFDISISIFFFFFFSFSFLILCFGVCDCLFVCDGVSFNKIEKLIDVEKGKVGFMEQTAESRNMRLDLEGSSSKGRKYAGDAAFSLTRNVTAGFSFLKQ